MDKSTERINADAERYTKDEGYQKAYIAGAMAEHNRLDKIFEDTMQRILNIASWADDPYKATLLRVVHNAQEQWSGTGKDVEKEVTDPCPHCGKELSRDRNLCCRECGKEAEK